MSKLAIALWSLIGYALVLAVFMVPALLIDGFVVLHLYEWFAMTSFHSLPSLTLSKAIGLSLFVSFLTTRFIYNYHPESENTKYLLSAVGVSYVGPWMMLLVGYLVHLFIV